MTLWHMQENIEPIVHALSARLLRRNIFCATAESCTGGWIAQELTSVAGSSSWFDCGFVAYSNTSKTRLLNVPAVLIDRYGAVSEEVARAMVNGAIAHSAAETAVAVTGIAGPDGGTLEKPVGTIAFGWRVPDAEQAMSEFQWFEGDRETVRWATVVHAIRGLLERL